MERVPQAANDGDLSTVRTALQQNDVPQASKDLALARACCSSHFEIARLLVEHGANPNGQYESAAGKFEYGPIILAPCEFLNAEGVKWLLDKGADPNGNPLDSEHFQACTPLEMVRDTYMTDDEARERCRQLLLASGAK